MTFLKSKCLKCLKKQVSFQKLERQFDVSFGVFVCVPSDVFMLEEIFMIMEDFLRD